MLHFITIVKGYTDTGSVHRLATAGKKTVPRISHKKCIMLIRLHLP